MRTKDQLRDLVARRLAASIHKQLQFSDLVAAVQSEPASQRELLINLLLSGRTKEAGELLEGFLKRHSTAQSLIQADLLLANNTLTLEELDLII